MVDCPHGKASTGPRDGETPGRPSLRTSLGRVLVLREPLGRQWVDELIRESLSFVPGELRVRGGMLRDDGDTPIPFQLARCQLDETGRWVLQADLCFLCSLSPRQTRSFRFGAATECTDWHSDLHEERSGGEIAAGNGLIAVRMPEYQDGTPVDQNTEQIAAPVLAVRGPDHSWRGAGRFISSIAAWNAAGRLVEDPAIESEFAVRKVSPPHVGPDQFNGKLKGARTRRTQFGPIFADYEIAYSFEQGDYVVRIRVLTGRPYVIVEEESTLPRGGAFVFSLHQSFSPDTGITNYRGQRNPYVLGRTDRFAHRVSRHLGTIPSHNLENFREIWYGACRSGSNSRDLIGLFRLDGASWSSGARIGIYEDPAPDLFLRMDLGEGRRRWALFAVDKEDRISLEVIRRNMEMWPYVYDTETAGGSNLSERESAELAGRWKFENRPHYLIQLMKTKADESPLDVVRRQSLEWEDIPASKRPVLWDGDRLRKRAEDPVFHRAMGVAKTEITRRELSPKLLWSDYFVLINRSLIASLLNDPSIALPVWDYLLNLTEQTVHDFLTVSGNSPTNLGAYNIGNQLKWLCWMYDLILPLGVSDHESDRQVKARLAYLAYKLTDPNYFPFDRPEGATNWNSSRFKAVAVFGLTFPRHPHSREFISHGVMHFRRELEESVFESGAYIESSGYQQSLMDPEFAYLLRDHTDFDPFSHPRYTAMFRYFIDMQTPRCPAYQRRTLPAVGDVTWDQKRPFDVLALSAEGVSRVDPTLAREMVWTASHGAAPGTEDVPFDGLFEHFLRLEPALPESPPRLASVEVKGFGAVLRADPFLADETYLSIKCGGGWGHYHSDENSFTLFGLGAPLALDSSKALYGTEQHRGMRSVWAHNTVAVNGRDQTGRRGRIERFVSRDNVDYVVADASEAAGARLFRRHILFVRNLYFAILDEVEKEDRVDFLLHALAEEVTTDAREVYFKGPFGVDLQAYFLLPSPVEIHEDEEPIQGYGHQKVVKASGKGPALTLLVPRKPQRPEVRLEAPLEDGDFRMAVGGDLHVVRMDASGVKLRIMSQNTKKEEVVDL